MSGPGEFAPEDKAKTKRRQSLRSKEVLVDLLGFEERVYKKTHLLEVLTYDYRMNSLSVWLA